MPEKTTFRLGLAQCTHPSDGDVASLVRRWFSRAADENADLIVFPESLSTPFELDPAAFAQAAEPIDGPLRHAFSEACCEFGMWAIYTVNEKPAPEDRVQDKPFNTAVLMDDRGVMRGSYRKVHLFDTDAAQESEKVQAGSGLFAPVQAPFATLGIAICYDLRFPEVACSAALKGCELMVYPSAWVDGPGKVRQWKSLLAARAIENGMYVAGLSRCDRAFGTAKRDYAGHSCVFDPTGAEIASAALGEELLVTDIDISLVHRMRESVPSLAHRRPDVYQVP